MTLVEVVFIRRICIADIYLLLVSQKGFGTFCMTQNTKDVHRFTLNLLYTIYGESFS